MRYRMIEFANEKKKEKSQAHHIVVAYYPKVLRDGAALI